MAKNKEVDKLLTKMYGIDYKTKGKKPSDLVKIFKVIKDSELRTAPLEKIPFTSDVKALLDLYLTNSQYFMEAYRNRSFLYKDMELMYHNCQQIARAIELTADEVIQVDSNNYPIQIEAKRPIRKKIHKLLYEDLKIQSILRATAHDVALHGNAVWLLSLDETGVTKVIHKEPIELQDRLEFVPTEVERRLQNKDADFTNMSSIARLDMLMNQVKNKKDIDSKFGTYLLGYQVDDYILPPWKVLHFRNPTAKSPFKPFGVPMYIHSMAAYKQYDSAMMMQVVARGLKYPKDRYDINLPNIIDPTDKLSRAVEFLAELQNTGINRSEKQMPGLNDIIITVRDLYEYSQQVPEIDLGTMDDIEMLRDDLILSTFLPRNLIDPNDSGFGDSGVSLIQKWKPFARQVYRVQSIILENITQLVKIHMIHSKDFTEKDLDFILTMPYPESQVDRDLIDNQKDLLDLANMIIDELQDRLYDGETLPSELITQIYQKFLPYDDEKIEDWIKQIAKAKERNDAEDEQDVDESGRIYSSVIRKTRIVNAMNERKIFREYAQKLKESKNLSLKEELDKIIFDKKQESLREGILNRMHYYSSRVTDSTFKVEELISIDKKILNKLQEDIKVNKATKSVKDFKEEYNAEIKVSKKKKKREEEKE